jgi:hypothetical protein
MKKFNEWLNENYPQQQGFVATKQPVQGAANTDPRLKDAFVKAIGKSRQILKDLERVVSSKQNQAKPDVLLDHIRRNFKMVAEDLMPFDRKITFSNNFEFRIINSALAFIMNNRDLNSNTAPQWVVDDVKQGNYNKIVEYINGLESELANYYKLSQQS